MTMWRSSLMPLASMLVGAALALVRLAPGAP